MANRKLSIGCVLIMGGALTNCGGTVETRGEDPDDRGGGGSGFVGVPIYGGFQGTIAGGPGYGGAVGTCCPGVPAGGGPGIPGGGAPGVLVGGHGGYVGTPGLGGEGGYVGVAPWAGAAGEDAGGAGGQPEWAHAGAGG